VKLFGTTVLGYSDEVTFDAKGYLVVNLHEYPEPRLGCQARYHGSPFFGTGGPDGYGATQLMNSFFYPYISGYARVTGFSVYEIAVTPQMRSPPSSIDECFPVQFAYKPEFLKRPPLPVTRPPVWFYHRDFGRFLADGVEPVYDRPSVSSDDWGYWGAPGGVGPTWPSWGLHLRANAAEERRGGVLLPPLQYPWRGWDAELWNKFIR
jgi:hypothetical protein